jgi:hypothetical protein
MQEEEEVEEGGTSRKKCTQPMVKAKVLSVPELTRVNTVSFGRDSDNEVTRSLILQVVSLTCT